MNPFCVYYIYKAAFSVSLLESTSRTKILCTSTNLLFFFHIKSRGMPTPRSKKLLPKQGVPVFRYDCCRPRFTPPPSCPSALKLERKVRLKNTACVRKINSQRGSLFTVQEGRIFSPENWPENVRAV